MSIFQKLFKNKNAVKKDKAIAFVDYEHWYYSIQKNFGLKPEPVSWRRKRFGRRDGICRFWS